MPATAFPFKRLFGDVILDIREIRIDGTQLPPHHVDREARTLTVYSMERANWVEVDVDLRVETPLQEIRGRNLSEDQLNLLLRLNCGPTNLRATEIVKLKDGVATATLSFRRDLIAERATIGSVVTYDSGDGIARILKESEEWTVLFAPPRVRQSSPGRRKGRLREFVDVKWESFTKSTISALRERPREAYFVDVTGSEPALYLNEDVDGYKELLSDRRGVGRGEQALRDLEYRRLALGTWLALVFSAIHDLEYAKDTEEIEFPDGWRREVLEQFVPRMFPGQGFDLGSRQVVRMKAQSTSFAMLLGLVQSAVNELVDASSVLRKHLTAMVESAA